ncbi:hypothetical protein F5Y13DRAFT_189530 [Hypoxylon sp. FL1857]|nr:hypothetical protein F5Y13DRAFT_189530 [Hypoxylon sp. FL1857]
MQYKVILNALFLPYLTLAVARGASECPIEQSSRPQIKITDFTNGQLDILPGDIDIPPRPSMATVSFLVTNPANQQQACSGSIVKAMSDEQWPDADGLDWFKCGTESAPDPTCWNCTHFQFGWGHGSWRLAINQTWPCAGRGGDACELVNLFILSLV